jgi:hypothetical protein
VPLGIRILLTVVRDVAESLKGFDRVGDGRIFLKISAALSLIINTYQMNLILAGSISLTGMVDKQPKNVL